MNGSDGAQPHEPHAEDPHDEPLARRRATAIVEVGLVVAVVATLLLVAPGGDPLPSAGADGTLSPTRSSPSGPTPTPTPTTDIAGLRSIYLWDPNTGDVTLLHQGRGSPDDAELSPDGERLVYERDAPDGSTQIYLLDRGGTERRLTSMKGGASDPTWSPDGKSIAFAARGPGTDAEDIFVMRVGNGAPARIAGTDKHDGHPDWSPDGTRIAFHARYRNAVPHGQIWITSVRTGGLTRLPSTVALDPAWSPDGRWIAHSRLNPSTFNGRIVEASIWVMRPDGSQERRIGVPPRFGEVRGNPTWSPDGRVLAFARSGAEYPDTWGSGDRVVLAATTTRWATTVTEGADDPSWDDHGILMVVPGDERAPWPRAAPFGLQVHRGVDATVTMTRSRCDLAGRTDLRSEAEVRLEFVDDSPDDAWFRIVRLRAGEAIDDALPLIKRPNPARVYVDALGVKVWTGRGRLGPGRWAVLCFRDVIPDPNGWEYHPVGIAGPLTIR
jgi:TolB protein